tara:strand:+ start:52 stop:603 length:552 start_codon:yes stop_codon:yes gene_type:complete
MSNAIKSLDDINSTHAEAVKRTVENFGMDITVTTTLYSLIESLSWEGEEPGHIESNVIDEVNRHINDIYLEEASVLVAAAPNTGDNTDPDEYAKELELIDRLEELEDADILWITRDADTVYGIIDGARYSASLRICGWEPQVISGKVNSRDQVSVIGNIPESVKDAWNALYQRAMSCKVNENE